MGYMGYIYGVYAAKPQRHKKNANLIQLVSTRYQVVYQVNDERSQQQVMPQQNIGPQCCL